jgi:hypothetical protein
MNDKELLLEILAGPLDGHIATLEDEKTWGMRGEGPLVFPWDAELGEPQARFFPEEGNWWLEGHRAAHGTYCINRGGRVEGRLRLEAGDILKASDTWLLVWQVE